MLKVADLSKTELTKIIFAINASSGNDFRNYTLSSFRLRIAKILKHYHLKSAAELITALKTDKSFGKKIINDLVTKPTEMFRDPALWNKLRTDILPELSKKESIEIWIPACATGEELYTLCILLHEMNLHNKTTIYASDISEDILSLTKKGMFTLKSTKTFQQNFDQYKGTKKLSDYYTVQGTSVQFKNSLLQNVKYKKHHLATSNSFHKFDLIICRNTLINYTNFGYEHALKTFSNSLLRKGFLVIGNKETISETHIEEKFFVVSSEEKIFQKKN